MNSLRTRLLASYITVIAICLSVIALALVIILRQSSLPARQTYENLKVVSRASLVGLEPNLNAEPEQIMAYITDAAEAQDVRTLLVDGDGTVFFDSAAEFAAGEAFSSNPDILVAALQNNGEGTFVDSGGEEWLFQTVPLRRTGGGGPQGGKQGQGGQLEGAILFAAPRPTLPLFFLFGSSLLGPLVRAGLIALAVSVVLAILISSSVARPLQRISQAASGIAEGDYDQQAPEKGPKEVRNLAASFNDMARKVKQTQSAQRDFLANVTHELRTPLTSIQGFSQAILDGAEQNPAHAARIIHDEAGRMHRMADELLDLARIESGQVVMARQHLDLHAILTAVVERLSIQAKESNVTLSADLSPLPPMTGDGDRLAQVFTNLIANALDHTPAGGQVTVSAAPGDSNLHVAVSDTGKGIPAGDLSRVFERFYQVDKSRARAGNGHAGAGLGLTISKEIVEAHGGVIRAESKEGQGATFRVWLPLPRPDDDTVIRPRPF